MNSSPSAHPLLSVPSNPAAARPRWSEVNIKKKMHLPLSKSSLSFQPDINAKFTMANYVEL